MCTHRQPQTFKLNHHFSNSLVCVSIHGVTVGEKYMNVGHDTISFKVQSFKVEIEIAIHALYEHFLNICCIFSYELDYFVK